MKLNIFTILSPFVLLLGENYGASALFKEELVQRTTAMARELNFVCKIYAHEDSGKSSAAAAQVLGKDPTSIIKALYVKDTAGNKLGVILRGIDKLNQRNLKQAWNLTFPTIPLKKVSMASSEELEADLGCLPGGTPPIIFFIKRIPTFVDQSVINLEIATGSGGTEFHAMEFDPKQLVSITQYRVADLTQDSDD